MSGEQQNQGLVSLLYSHVAQVQVDRSYDRISQLDYLRFRNHSKCSSTGELLF